MKANVAAVSHVNAGSSASRRPLARLLALGAAAALVAALLPGAVMAAPPRPVSVPAAAPAQPNAPSKPNAAHAKPAVADSGDWTQFRHDATHSGFNAAENTISTSNVDALDVAWTATTAGEIELSSPAVADGVVYVGSNDGKLYAFELNPLDHLVLSPSSSTITAGESQAYTAEGFDASNNSLGDVTSATTFTISGTGSCTVASTLRTLTPASESSLLMRSRTRSANSVTRLNSVIRKPHDTS